MIALISQLWPQTTRLPIYVACTEAGAVIYTSTDFGELESALHGQDYQTYAYDGSGQYA